MSGAVPRPFWWIPPAVEGVSTQASSGWPGGGGDGEEWDGEEGVGDEACRLLVVGWRAPPSS